MLKRILTSFIALVLLAQTITAQNQETARPSGDWTIVELLKNGEKLSIELKNGKSIKGKLANVTDTGLSISEGKKTSSLSRDDVLRVYQVIGRTRGKSALRGAGIGGAIGTGGGLIIYLPARDDGLGVFVPILGAIGVGIGAVVGLAFSDGQRRVLIYQAR
jgi:hypothetical protein